jgi:hypothetical protein
MGKTGLPLVDGSFWNFSTNIFGIDFVYCDLYSVPNKGSQGANIFLVLRDPPLFISKLLIKFQNILRNTTQVIVRHKICLHTNGHGETSIPPYNFVAGNIQIIYTFCIKYQKNVCTLGSLVWNRVEITINKINEEDPFHFWWFSLLPFQNYWTWYDGK